MFISPSETAVLPLRAWEVATNTALFMSYDVLFDVSAVGMHKVSHSAGKLFPSPVGFAPGTTRIFS